MKYQLSAGVRFIATPTGAFIVSYDTSECHALNKTGRSICAELQSGATPEHIQQQLREQFDGAPSEQIAADVDSFLARLRGRSLVQEIE